MTDLDKNSKNQFVILDRDGTIILETQKSVNFYDFPTKPVISVIKTFILIIFLLN